ncbi:hypothetical protein FRC17_004301 [Serendipita sp. 399]|nr:hypothetical protein FRC17_004301 [Serendipita sp. 399]
MLPHPSIDPAASYHHQKNYPHQLFLDADDPVLSILECAWWSPRSTGLNIISPVDSQDVDYSLSSPTSNPNSHPTPSQDLERERERDTEKERERQAAITRDLDAQLRMWTEAQFPDVTNETFFPSEKDSASRSRHKALNPSLSAPAGQGPHGFPLGVFGGVGGMGHYAHGINDLNFFGNVGQDLLSGGPSNSPLHADTHKDAEVDSPAAAHERAKQQQMQGLHALYAHHHLQTAQPQSMNDFFGWGFNSSSVDALFANENIPGTTTERTTAATEAVVDPFLTLRSHPGSTSASAHPLSMLPPGFGLPPLSTTSNPSGGDGLQPLTVRGTASKDAMLLAQAQAQALSIDPAATSLNHRPQRSASVSTAPRSSVDLDHPSKRPRTHKLLSIAIDRSLNSRDDEDEEMEDEATSPMTPSIHSQAHGSPSKSSGDGTAKMTHPDGTPLTAAEDKRRRNTLASARFRLKKKEREAAMEHKAKELDDKVANLERECESLRKENKWLKSLVVGTAVADEDSIGTLPSLGYGSSSASTADFTAGSGITAAKERRDESELSASNITGLQSAAKGGVIDLDELVRVLKANGAIITGSTAAGDNTPSKAKAGGPTTATGKRKRNGGGAN